MHAIFIKNSYKLRKVWLPKRTINIGVLRAIVWLMISIGLVTVPALAKQDNKAPSKRFTAERVFDMEYANDP